MQACREILQRFREMDESARPKIRWWIPGAQTTAEELKAELRSMKDAGFLGAEICSMPYTPPTDPEVFNYRVDWGKENWNVLMREVLLEAGRLGMKIDFMMTPGWPLALPGEVDPDDPANGIQMETDGIYIEGITREHPYEGRVPVPEAALTDAKAAGGRARLEGIAVARYADKEKHILEFASARALKEGADYRRVCAGEEEYEVSFCPEEEGEYLLFAWWKHPSGSRTCGNLQLDHYGRGASERLIRFWEDTILPSFGEAAENIDNMFIDSLEYTTHLDWTEGLLKAFEETCGYDFTPYLPAVYDEDWIGNFAQIPHPDFSFDVKNEQLANDFASLLTDLYIENHLKPIEEFCLRHGIGLRYQTAYGKTLENARTAMHVTVPETESLYGADLIDFYRLQSGAVHMTGKKIYSIETAPENVGRGNGDRNSGNYQQCWHNLLWHAHRSLAGGVNQLVLHGYSYRGHYDGAGSENGHLKDLIWPGYEGMGSYDSFSNSWGERQPNWLHARQYTDYMTRVQYMLRQGQMKVDLAVFAQRYFERIDFVGAVRIFDSPVLEDAGYTYEFLCPAHFRLENARVEDGRLAKDGPGYRALIFDNQESLPAEVAEKTLEFARKGLPVIFIGRIPSSPSSCRSVECASSAETKHSHDMTALMEALDKEGNVRFIREREDILAVLKELHILPDTCLGGDGQLLGVHRQADGNHFYLICNVGHARNYREIDERRVTVREVRLKGTGTPYRLDPWSGKTERIADFRREGDYLAVPVSLQENDTCLIAMTEEEIPECGCGAALAEGEPAKELVLTGWTLEPEAWLPGALPVENAVRKLEPIALDSLKSWRQIPGMEEMSGIGTYRTSFWMEDSCGGAVLKMPPVHDSYSLYLNGREVPVNPMCCRVSVGEYLKPGENAIEIRVSSTLLNAVLANARAQGLKGVRRPEDIQDWDDYGILGEITLRYSPG
ncbi:MAG: hypothetical protein HFH97_09730 [Lachnospiraceae bacterium]|nr:glycosyl hydrolase [uncultured Acetatifactor sp.]MCI9572874.1 hypothetical protein [Lachnospiraceae bacterium]